MRKAIRGADQRSLPERADQGQHLASNSHHRQQDRIRLVGAQTHQDPSRTGRPLRIFVIRGRFQLFDRRQGHFCQLPRGTLPDAKTRGAQFVNQPRGLLAIGPRQDRIEILLIPLRVGWMPASRNRARFPLSAALAVAIVSSRVRQTSGDCGIMARSSGYNEEPLSRCSVPQDNRWRDVFARKEATVLQSSYRSTEKSAILSAKDMRFDKKGLP
jgi:hypothetical protein